MLFLWLGESVSRYPRPILDASSLEQAINALQGRIDELEAHVSQQQKLATLGMVAAVIAHEFNNILTPMISYTRYALSDGADEALKNKALQKALAGAEKAATISQSLLGFTRGEEGTIADVHKCVQETLTCLSRDLGKDGINLTLQIDESLKVHMNPGQLQQVFMNMIVNARSAMLQANSGLRRMVIRAERLKNGKIAEIHVSDTGPGIPADVLPHIFEPFYSTKRKNGAQKINGNADASVAQAVADKTEKEEAVPKGGTGLGLTISQELILAAGGTLRCMSEVGKGTTFIIELPVGEE